jgi:iron complex transport system substrate-binding protein
MSRKARLQGDYVMMRNKPSIVSVFLVLLFLIPPAFISARGSAEKEEPAPGEQSWSVTVTDSIGNQVRLDALPQRIVVAGRATLLVADALYLFPEVHGKVIGLGLTNQGLGDFIPYLDPGLDEKKRVPHEIGPEHVAALQPDLFLVKDSMYESLGAPVAGLGIPTVALSLETPEQYKKDIAILGQVLNNQARAEEILNFYEDSLSYVRERTAKVPAESRPEVLLLSYTERGGTQALNIPPAGWIQTTQVEEAGGIPVWKESHQGGGWKTVNFEQIASWNPEYIFITSFSSTDEHFMPKLLSDQRWQELRAVQEGKIHAVPADFHSWAQPDTRWILAVSWISKILYPDLYRDLDMTDEVMRFYTQLYGADRELVERLVLPRVQGALSD